MTCPTRKQEEILDLELQIVKEEVKTEEENRKEDANVLEL